jgi:hypothetical protein
MEDSEGGTIRELGGTRRSESIHPGIVVRSIESRPVPVKFLLPCFLGLIIIIVGYLIFGGATTIEGNWDLRQTLLIAGFFAAQIGGAILSAGLFVAGFLAKGISQNTRLGLIVSGALVVGLFLRLIPYSSSNIWFG